MYREINDEIVRLKESILKKNKYKKQLTDYEQELADVENTVAKYTEQLEKEKQDVQKLERFGMASFIAMVSGTKYEKLDKEEQEVVAVQLKLEEAKKAKQEIMDSISGLRQSLRHIMDSERELQQLLVKKKELIKDTNPRYSDQLYQLDEQEADLQAYITEINEAITAGGYVLAALDRAMDSLGSAKSWGIWDIVGGGFIATSIKHSHIEKAEDNISIAQYRLRSFQKELLDVRELVEINIDMSSMLKYADYFIDDVIVDFMVQRRISGSLMETERQLIQVNTIVKRLKNIREENENTLQQVRNEKQAIINAI